MVILGIILVGMILGMTGKLREKHLKKTSEIISIRTNGFSEDYLNNHKRTIREDIRKFHILTGCLVCGSHSALVIDHKK